jgi:hypothetical protein
MSNPTQADQDQDGEGDWCDCENTDANDRHPMSIAGFTAQRTGLATASLQWSPAPGADSYSISRGDLSVKAAGYYGLCQVNGLRGTTYDDTQVPNPGQGFFYLVQGQSWDCGLGTLGFAGSELERVNTAAGHCLGTTVTDRVATGESTPLGVRIGGTYHDTQNSENVYEHLGEQFYTTAWELEQRYVFTIGTGSVKELHVEGYHPLTSDNEGFTFAWSTDLVNWNPITMSGVFPANDAFNQDLVGALPAGVTGSVQIRIMDTVRSASEQVDELYIDKIWIRAVP